MAYGNCGGDNTSWEVLGDQSGKEWCLSDSPRDESSKWIALFRYPNKRVQEFIANQSIAACLNDNCGYSQSHRQTFWQEFQKNGYDASKISVKCGSDCSASSSAFAKAAGIVLNIPSLAQINQGNTTKSLEADFVRCGFQVFHDTEHTRNSANRLPGDILLSSGHASVWVFNGAKKDIPEYVDVSDSYLATDYLTQFINEANKHVGETDGWTKATMRITTNTGWSAAFVSAIAKTIGCQGTLIPDTYIVSSIAEKGVKNGMGSWIPGPFMTKSAVVPQKGDIAFFRNKQMSRHSEYDADYCSIVRSISVGQFETIGGDVDGKVAIRTINGADDRCIGFYRPLWNNSQDATSIQNSLYAYGMYAAELRREDATIREIGYLNTKSDGYNPSSNESKIKLGIINYTSFLSDLLIATGTIKLEEGESYSYMSTPVITNYSYADTSVFEDVSLIESDDAYSSPAARQCVSAFKNKGYNSACACAASACIYHKSGFDTNKSILKSNTLKQYGIAGWTGERFQSMKKYCGPNWQNDFTKQLEYIMVEVDSKFNKTIAPQFNKSRDTLDNCQKAVDIFLQYFDNKSDMNATKIKATARAYYEKIIMKQGLSRGEQQKLVNTYSSKMSMLF